jgi:hypothetical protein
MAPRFASNRAVGRPIPLLAPVIATTLPVMPMFVLYQFTALQQSAPRGGRDGLGLVSDTHPHEEQRQVRADFADANAKARCYVAHRSAHR